MTSDLTGKVCAVCDNDITDEDGEAHFYFVDIDEDRREEDKSRPVCSWECHHDIDEARNHITHEDMMGGLDD